MQTVPVKPGKLMALLWPLYVLTAVAVAVHPSAWCPLTSTSVFVLSTPVLFLLVGLAARGRWRAMLTD